MTARGEGFAVLVLARAPRPGRVKRGLEPLLGAAGCARLQTALIARTARWALEAAAPGAAYFGFEPADATPEVAPLVPESVRLVERGETAPLVAEVAAATGLPVVVAGVSVPALGPDHAAAVAADLAAGLDVCVGPTTEGGCYLVAVREPRPELLAAHDTPAQALAAAHAAGLGVGLLRSERPLRTPADAAALLADPCAPADVVAALSSPAPGP